MESQGESLRVNGKWLMVASIIENDSVLQADSEQVLQRETGEFRMY